MIDCEVKWLNQVNFEIVKIFSGWFDVEFRVLNTKIAITASNVWGNDSPQKLLQMIFECLNQEQFSKYVVFDDEPGTYIVIIEKREATVLTILYSEWDDDEWTNLGLSGDLSIDEIKKHIPIEEELIEFEMDLHFFARTMFRAFEEYSSGDRLKEYEGNWMEFPLQQYSSLKTYLECIK